MPYEIGEKGTHNCSGFPVVNSDTGKVMGCHKTKEEAKKQLAALYIHVEDVKDKSVNLDTTKTYAAIIKQEKQDDGTLLVYGKATDDSVDIDQQICDAGWLEKAMPEWFKTGGNIREQHSNIAAGVAKELNSTNDGHYISALVVDPVSVKKVETGVLKGFSIGIRSPRIVRDNKAANGRIIDGQIVEVSLVDRPANPNAKLMLAKSNGTEVIQVEELIEEELPKVEETVVDTPAVETPVEESAEKADMPKPTKEEALHQLGQLRAKCDEMEKLCKELGYIEEEDKQYGETAEQETEEGSEPNAAEEEVSEARGEKPLDKAEETHKCLECGCNQPANSHGVTQLPNGDNVSTAVMVTPNETPKSVSTIIPPSTVEEIGTVIEEEELESEEDSAKSALSDSTISDIIEKAVKSATESVTNEINSYRDEINKLQAELATAQNKAVGNGPKRFAVSEKVKTEMSDFLSKAADFRAKSASATDKELARGYRELAEDFEAKARALTIK